MSQQFFWSVIAAALLAPPAFAADPPPPAETPQAPATGDRTMEVLGLGKVRFAPNGDLFDKDGNKLFDGATKEWTHEKTPRPTDRFKFDDDEDAWELGRRDGFIERDGGFVPLDGLQPVDAAAGFGSEEYASGGAKPSATYVPAVRIGATFEECKNRMGEPLSSPLYHSFTHAGWAIDVSVCRGLVNHVAYRRELGKTGEFTSKGLYGLVDKPDAVLLEVRRLHNEKRKWIEVAADATAVRGDDGETVMAGHRPTAAELADTKTLLLPKVTWRSADGLLQHSYAIEHSKDVLSRVLTVSTPAFCEQEEGKSDFVKMNRDDALDVWELGNAITVLTDKDSSQAKNAMRDAAILFAGLRGTQAARVADPELAVWDPPVATGDDVTDRRALRKFAKRASDRVIKALGRDAQEAGEPVVVACFILGRNTHMVPDILLKRDKEFKSSFLESFAFTAGHCNLPKTVWEPVVEKAKAGAPAADITQATEKMCADVTQYLDTKRAEWKPKAQPVEK